MTKYIFQRGLMLAGIQIAITLLLYFAGVEYLVSIWISLLIIALFIFLVIRFGISYRKAHNNVLVFKDAFVLIFFILLTSGFLQTNFNLVLYNVIDKELPTKINEAIIVKTTSMMERFNVPQEEIDKAIDKMQHAPNKFGPAELIKGFVWSAVLYGILALIIGAIIKRNPLPFTDNPNIMDAPTS